MEAVIDFDTVVPKLDAILSRGLSHGLGSRNGQMCIEAAVCAALDLPHNDDPQCVASAVRRFKIRLNDSQWSSPAARAAGLRDLGIAQLGSKDDVDNKAFAVKVAEGTIRRLIPALLRDLWPQDVASMAAADRCEQEGTHDATLAARDLLLKRAAADAAYDAYDAADAAYDAASAASAASAAYAAADAKFDRNKYLCLSASIALDVLRELRSPGAIWLDAHTQREA